jgi:hypothetical protein
MSKTKFVEKKEIGELLGNIITIRGIFSKIEYTTWKLIFESVQRLSEYLEGEYKHLKGSQATMFHSGKALYDLKNITNVFIENCIKKQKFPADTPVNSKENVDFLDNYRKEAIPLIIKFASQLDTEHPLRTEIEKALNSSHLPMMY